MERDIAQLKQILQSETQVLNQLVEVLGEEREALSSRDVVRLEEVTAKKVSMLDAVDSASSKRADWAQARGITEENSAFNRFINETAGHADDAELIEAWDKLRNGLREVHRENLVNGRIIARSRQTLSQLLHVLRGQVDTPKLYGRGGETRGPGGSGEIARA